MRDSTHNIDIDTRLHRIEKSANRWRLATFSLVALIGIGTMAGQANRQTVSKSLLEEIVGQPKVVGIAPVMGKNTQNETSTTVGLVRVWSDGSTDMMGGYGDEIYRLFTLRDNDYPRGFDSDSEQWWPYSVGVGYVPYVYWRPFVDEDLSAP